MIINVNSQNFNVDILKDFSLKYTRAIKFQNTYNGSLFVSDRGRTSDKYDSTITVLDSDVSSLVDALYQDQGTLTIDTEGFEIFGAGIDYSSPIECLYKSKSYPIRDTVLSKVVIDLRPVTELAFDGGVVSEFPTIYYKPTIDRKVDVYKNNYDAIKIGDYGTLSSIDNLGNNLKRESVSFTITMEKEDCEKLHKYLATTARGNSFALPYNELVMSLFIDDSVKNVKCTNFTMKRDSSKFWEVGLTLVKE